MTEFRDITPEGNRCALQASCPSVHISEDGKTLRIRGAFYSPNDTMVLLQEGDEADIDIPVELMAGYVALCQANSPVPGEASSREGALQTRPSPSSDWQPPATAPSHPILAFVEHCAGTQQAVVWRDGNRWSGGPALIPGFKVLAWRELPENPSKDQCTPSEEARSADDVSPAAIGQPDTTGAPPAPED